MIRTKGYDVIFYCRIDLMLLYAAAVCITTCFHPECFRVSDPAAPHGELYACTG